MGWRRGLEDYLATIMTYNPTPMRGPSTRGQAVTGEFDQHTSNIMPDADVTHVHLLRHGEVELLTERVVRGQLDVELSAEGRRQSSLLASWFARTETKPDAIWSSDLVRCTELGEELSRLTGVALQRSSNLREQDMGAWQGRTWKEITVEDGARVTAYWDDYVNARPRDGESFGDLCKRVYDWWDEEWPELTGRRIVLVTHIGVIRALQCRFLGVELGEALRFAPSVASHSALLLSAAGAVTTSFGERPWTFGAPA